MAPTIQCPSCRQSYQVQPQLIGKTVQCKCGAKIKIPKAGAAPSEGNGLSKWMDEELSAIEQSQKQEAEKAQLAAAEAEEKQRRLTADAEKERKGSRKKQRTVKQLAIRAIISSVIVVLLGIGGGALGVWYIATHPVEGASKEARANRLGQGLGTIVALGGSLPWLVFAYKVQRAKKKK